MQKWEGAVGLTITGAVEPVAPLASRRRRQAAVRSPQSMAKPVSLYSRPWLSPARRDLDGPKGR
jgi:hypothetical protein